MKDSLPEIINEWDHMVTEGIPTMNVLQEPDLNKYFIYENNNNNNCIDRSKSKRKALIINCWDNDIDKNRIIDILKYLEFDITVMDVYCDNFNSGEDLQNFIKEYSDSYFDNFAVDDDDHETIAPIQWGTRSVLE